MSPINPVYKILLGIAVFVALAIAFMWYIQKQYDAGWTAGKDSCVAQQATAQVEHTKTVKATYDKIDRDTPSGLIDDRATIDFLLGHTRSTGN